MDFGKKYRVGNFEIMKMSRSLSKKETEQLRRDAGVPDEVKKHLSRSSLPYIKLKSVSGNWSLELHVGLAMFNIIDGANFNEKAEVAALTGLISRFYVLTTVLGDAKMEQDIEEVFSDYMKRIKAPKADEKAEKEILEGMNAENEARKNIEEFEKGLADESK